MVENMKEGILGLFFAGKFVHIIDNQYIDHLIKVKEVILVIVPDSVHKLGLKLVGIHIQHCFFREQFLYFNADGLGQVGFAQATVAVYKQRIKGCTAWILCYQIFQKIFIGRHLNRN